MSISIAILPTAGLTIEQHQQLGQALRESLGLLELTEEAPRTPGTPSPIDDLLAGEQPTPMIQRIAAVYRAATAGFEGPRAIPSPAEAASQARKQLRGQPLVDLLEIPAVTLTYHGDGGLAIVEKINARLPEGSVKEIRIIR